MPLEGGAETTLVSGLGENRGLRVDGTDLYYALPTSISKVPLTGGTPAVVVSDVAGIGSFDIDGGYAYWVGENDGVVRRSPVAAPATTVIGSGPVSTQDAYAIEVDGADVYWARLWEPDGALMRVPSDGSAAATTVWSQAVASVSTFTMDETHVYLAVGSGVRKVPRVGGPVVYLPLPNAMLASYAYGIALDTTNAYWTTADMMETPPGMIVTALK